MPISRITRIALAGLVCTLTVAGQGAAAQGTTYKIRTVTGVERVTLNGPTTLAGAPATLAVTMVVKWKAGPAGSYGTTTLSRNPPAGQKRLCASNTCPTYGPMSGTARITGSVTPIGGGPALSCVSSKTLTSIFGKGSSSLAQTIEIYKSGRKRLVGFTPSQYSFLLQETVPDPACRVFLDETTLGSAATDPFPVSKLGNATMDLAVRATIPLGATAGQPGAGVTGTAKVTFLSTLKRL